jgi:hypothetical protein
MAYRQLALEILEAKHRRRFLDMRRSGSLASFLNDAEEFASDLHSESMRGMAVKQPLPQDVSARVRRLNLDGSNTREIVAKELTDWIDRMLESMPSSPLRPLSLKKSRE